MKIIVVAHPRRSAMVEQLGRHLPIDLIVTDEVSAFSGHRKAIASAAQTSERVVIMEDDAVPVIGFHVRAQMWFDRHPDDLLSFYLGTSRPPQYQPAVDMALRQADLAGQDSIRLGRMLHAVCYSLPLGGPQKVLAGMRLAEADFAIGAAWGQATVYPVESLVEHRDTMPVERHPDGQQRSERRVARRLAGKLMFQP